MFLAAGRWEKLSVVGKKAEVPPGLQQAQRTSFLDGEYWGGHAVLLL